MQYTNDKWQWWLSRQLRYNKGLALAGFLAFIAYCVVGEIWIVPHEEFEVTLFTTILQGIGYLFMMFVANVFYTLGYVVDHVFNKQDSERFRSRLYNLGYWFSFVLPFSIPVLVAYIFIDKYGW